MDEHPSSLFVVGVAIILDRDGLVLLGKRRSGRKIRGGIWEFPSGRIDAGESPLEGLKREAMEELGINVEPIQLVNSYGFKRADQDGILLNYWCRSTEEPRISDEHDELVWMTYNEAIEHLSFEDQRNVLRLFQRIKQLFKDELA